MTNCVLSASFLPILLLGAIAGCGTRAAARRPAVTLDSAEVSEYQGQKLSSPEDFHENSIKGPQHVDTMKYRLTVTGKVDSTRTYTYGQVVDNHQHYTKVVWLDCVEGWQVKILWEGVLVKDLLNEAGIDSSAKVVIFTGVDGYTTSEPLSYIMDKNIMLACKMNGAPLRANRGFPFELVAEDKWGYKWIKWVTKIELSDDVNYQGYWERRGYSNDGDLKKSFIGQ